MKTMDQVWVCNNCLTASCFNGEFFCEEYEYSGIILKTVKELKELDYEDPHHWEKYE